MPEPILLAKLSAPPLRSRLVARSRLIRKLDQGVESGFVLVSAPAGYGKSTVLSAWVSQMQWPAAWLSLDDRDNDPARFLAYLAAALRTIEVSVGEELESPLQSASPPAIEMLLTSLVNRLAQFDRHFWLILDDYHFIQNQAVHQAIGFLLEHRPAPLHLAIATRADPPLPLARLRVRSQMVELRLADLRFSPQEASEFLREGMGLNLSEADVAALEASTEGWIAGLQMAALSLQGRADPSGFIRSFGGEHRYVLDFLFDEVFQRQPEETREFLLQTSVLERFCASLCNAVTARENSQAILDDLERGNLFLIALDEQRQWYRYHHLFGDLLQSRLKRALPDAGARLHRRASEWYAAEHDLENAIAHAFAAEDYERAANLVEEIIPALDLLNQQALLTSWVDRLPRETLATRPWLCLQRAWADLGMVPRGKVDEWVQIAEEFAERAFEEGHPERRSIQGYIAIVRGHIAMAHEDIPRVLEMGQAALKLLPDGDETWGGMGVALGLAYWGLGDVVQSEQAFRRARAADLKIGNTRAVAATCYAGIQQLKQGCLQDAQATFQDALHLATRPDGRETPIAAFPHVRLGDLWRERNDLALAARHLDLAVEQSIRLAQADVIVDVYAGLGRYRLATGDMAGTWDAVEQADRVVLQRTEVTPYVLCWLDECRVRAWLAAGDLEAAALWARQSGLSPDGPLKYHHDLPHQNLARVLVAQAALGGSRSAYEQAAALLARLRVAAEQAGWVHERIKILVMQAVNDQARGTRETALQNLALALSLAQPGGYVRVFVDEGQIVRGLLATLADRWRDEQSGARRPAEDTVLLARYVSGLLPAFDRPAERAGRKGPEPAGLPVPSEPMIEPLSEREMEVLSLLAQGFPDKKIAATLVIAPETVHKHLKNIYGKLGVHSRTEAIARARELGLV